MSFLSNYNEARGQFLIELRKAAKHLEIAQNFCVDYSHQHYQDLLSEAWAKVYMIQKEMQEF